MMKLRTTLFVTMAGCLLAACAPNSSGVVGTYNGILSSDSGDVEATCVVERIDDNTVKVNCNPSGGGGFMIDNLGVTREGTLYGISANGFGGTVNGKVFEWVAPPYGFAGTK